VTFAIVSVKDHIATNAARANEFIAQLTPIYGCPVVLMGENNRRLFGDTNIVRFLEKVHPNQIPWQQGYIDFPEPEAPQDNVVTWHGASGVGYTYRFFPIGSALTPEQDGNYIFALPSSYGWVPIYIGQGFLPHRANSSHHQWQCISSKGATHIHLRVNTDEGRRLYEEDDLLMAHPEAYSPTGCNDRIGG
jgi:hypothetical protein